MLTEKEVKNLLSDRVSLFDHMSMDEKKNAFSFAEEYQQFLNLSKTEREFVNITVEDIKEHGFVDIDSLEKLQPGDKVYRVIHGKGICMAVIGTDSAKNGFNLLGAHIDSPRADFKPNPVFESSKMGFMKTHYYGGIKKYQWTAIPLAIHGVIYKKDGKKLELNIGEDKNDPVFTFTDLLPHLGRRQMELKASEVIKGEQLNLLVSSKPYQLGTSEEEIKKSKDLLRRYKLGLLELLYEKYGIEEQDFARAELEIVPAFKARFVGFDKSFIAAYGQDDRVCAYTALRAILTMNKPKRTALCFLYDKEEIGSDGNTGAKSRLYENFQAEIFAKSEGIYDELAFRKHLSKSYMLSTDVTNGFDPNWPDTCDVYNTNYMGCGLGIFKYTGAAGKSGASDASAELMLKCTQAFDKSNILWQVGELGAVDVGGGGTICKYAAETGMNVLDCGVPVLSMHSPYELTHTLDVYNLYLAYVAFLNNIEEA